MSAGREPHGFLRLIHHGEASSLGNNAKTATLADLEQAGMPGKAAGWKLWRHAQEALRVSEEKFARIFHLSPDAITINRLEDGVYIDANQRFSEILGYTREEVIGRSSLPGDLGIWVDGAARSSLWALLDLHGEAIGFEAQFRRKDGTILTGLMSAKVLDINGERWLLAMTRDISERKQAEDALRETAQRLELATASGRLGIWDHDLRDGSLLWDEQMFNLYGLDRETFHPSHQAWRERVHPDDLPQVEEATRAAIAGDRPYDVEFRVKGPGGAVKYVKANGILIRDAAGRAQRMIGINRDRTEQKEAELEQQRLQAELQHAEKLESIGSLAGGIAHDMNNVLAAILIMTSVLRERCQDGDPMAKGLDTIMNAGNRGKDLVKSLTDFSRKGLEEHRPFDVNEVLAKEMDLLHRTTRQKVRLSLEREPGLPKVLGDASAFGNAIMNLSVNALDAMPQGGQLTFGTRALPGGLVEVTVRDTGIGMSPEVLSRALEPFFTTKPAGKGTGLGLARVYGTITAHGGTVDIQSTPGEGTTVLLRLPGIPETAPTHADPGPNRSDRVPASLKCLVVDDEALMREAIPLVLESLGHRVETAASGQEALNFLETRQDFDLIMLDHNMPGLTGVETLTRLRGCHPDLTVILSSGFLDEDAENTLAGCSRVWILKKPYDKQDLQQLLATIGPRA